MATIKNACTLKHQSNLGEDVEEVSFEAGEQVTVLKEWGNRFLVKNAAGQLFNVAKDQVEA
jgi:hypothetical protein